MIATDGVIGRARTAPMQFYYHNMNLFGSYVSFPMKPQVLADLLLRNKVLAGPVAALDFARLRQDGCEPLSDFSLFINPYLANPSQEAQSGSLSALIHSPYVLMTQKPLDDLGYVRIGIDEDIVSDDPETMLLVKLLFSFYWQRDHEIHGELSMDDHCWVVRGGPYLSSRPRHFFGFPFAYDLTWEWYRWKKTPFPFYHWICAPGLDEEQREDITKIIRRTLELNLRNLAQWANHEARIQRLDRGFVLNYFQGFGHRLGLWKSQTQSCLQNLVDLLHETDLADLKI